MLLLSLPSPSLERLAQHYAVNTSGACIGPLRGSVVVRLFPCPRLAISPKRPLQPHRPPALSGSSLAITAWSPTPFRIPTPRTPLFSVTIACFNPGRRAMLGSSLPKRRRAIGVRCYWPRPATSPSSFLIRERPRTASCCCMWDATVPCGSCQKRPQEIFHLDSRCPSADARMAS